MSDHDQERLTAQEKEKLIAGDEDMIIKIRLCRHCTKRLLNEFEKDNDFFHQFSSAYIKYMINKRELLTLNDLLEKK
jgi:hypothetical protein